MAAALMLYKTREETKRREREREAARSSVRARKRTVSRKGTRKGMVWCASTSVETTELVDDGTPIRDMRVSVTCAVMLVGESTGSEQALSLLYLCGNRTIRKSRNTAQRMVTAE